MSDIDYTLSKARTCIERWRRRGYEGQVETFEAVISELERLRVALSDVLSYVPHGDMPVTIYDNARAALESGNG